MINNLLGVANAALQIHRGRHTGASGLVGLGIALLIIFQWEHVVSLLDLMGIISFFERNGLIHEEMEMTVANILFFFLKVYLVVTVVVIILLFVLALIAMFFSTQFGEKLQLGLLLIVVYPVVIIMLPFILIFNAKKTPWTKKRGIQLREKQLREYLKYLVVEIPREEVVKQLDRLPTNGDSQFLLGVTEDNYLYLLLPFPVCNQQPLKLTCQKIWMEWYVPGRYKKHLYDYEPQRLWIKRQETLSRKGEEYNPCKIDIEKFIRYYKSDSIDFNSFFKVFSNSPEYYQYILHTSDKKLEI